MAWNAVVPRQHTRRCQRCQSLRQSYDWRAQHAREEMVQVLSMTMNSLDDLRIPMADQCGHLSRSPVQHAMSQTVHDRSTFSMNDDLGMECRSCHRQFWSIPGDVLPNHSAVASRRHLAGVVADRCSRTIWPSSRSGGECSMVLVIEMFDAG